MLINGLLIKKSVFISDKWIIADSSLPRLKSLKIEGVLEISSDTTTAVSSADGAKRRKRSTDKVEIKANILIVLGRLVIG